jgi:S1-C subfamily serine protease
MVTADWVALGFVALAAIGGMRTGLVGSALSVAGVVAGAVAGARIGPHLLPGGSSSPYTPIAGLVGALVAAVALQAAASFAGAAFRRMLLIPPLRTVDSLGGLVLGMFAGVVIVWIVGASVLVLPGQPRLRHEAERSHVLHRLNSVVPPRRLLNLLARIDPLPSITGPAPPTSPPDPTLLRNPAVRAAAASVVKILGTACGVGVEGSGWIAARGLVVTAAHVVAGEPDTTVNDRPAIVVAFDARNDVAVLRVPGLEGRPLRLTAPHPGTAVAILGFPEGGPFAATPGRIGRTAVVITRDAYGHGPTTRAVTALAGGVRHGNSGGPAVDTRGAVEATVFASRVGSPGGYGVPAAVVRRALASSDGPVSSGGCASP